MAREHARLLTSIWRDPDWVACTPMQQWLYEQLISRAEINHAGVIALNLKKWAKAAAGVTVADIDDWLEGLAGRNFIVVDEDTDEVLVRAFIRRDGVAKQPNILVSACRLARQVESEAIRAALALELRRIAEDLTNEKALGEVFTAVVELDPDGPEPPRPSAVHTPKRGTNGQQMTLSAGAFSGVHNSDFQARTEDAAEPSGEPLAEPFQEPHGVGEGVGEGGSTCSGGPVLQEQPPRANTTTIAGRRRAVELVDARIPTALDRADRDRLVAHAARALDRDVTPTAVGDGIDRWLARDNVTPGLLPKLISDAVKRETRPVGPRTAPRPGADTKVAGWADVAAELAAEDHPPGTHDRALPPGATS